MKTSKILKTLGANVGLFNFSVFLSIIVAISESVGVTSLVTILIYGDFFQFDEIKKLFPSFFFNDYFKSISKGIQLKTVIILFTLIIVIRQIFTFTSNAIILNSQTTIEANLRKKILKCSIETNIDQIKRTQSGDFVNFLIYEPSNISTILIHLFKIYTNVILMSLYLVILIVFNYYIIIFFSVLILIVFFISKFLSKLSYEIGTVIKNRVNNLFREVLEIFRSIRLVKLSNLESKTKLFFEKEIEEVRKQNYKYLLSKVSMETFTPLLVIILLVMIAPLTESNKYFSLLEFGIYFGISLRIYNLFTQYSVDKITLSRKFAHIENYENFLNKIDKSPDIKGGKDPFVFNSSIEFKNVNFSHGNNKILNLCNFRLIKNKITAIVGKSGSGKSTILDLLTYLYEPTAGKILVDGKNYSTIKKEDIRANIGMVSQDINIINDSIRKNLTFTSNRKISDSEILKVAKIAGISEFISSRSDGLDSKIGDSGSLVSGGQLQRIAFARCILERKKFLILDEPTSSMDKNTSKFIANYLKSIKNKMTVLIVAHSSDIVRYSHHIYLLEKKKTSYLGQFKNKSNFKYKGLK